MGHLYGRHLQYRQQGNGRCLSARAAPGSAIASVPSGRCTLPHHYRKSSDGGLRQFVILGAGLDARAFRLAWPPGVRLVELDTSEVISFKERVVASIGAKPGCERIVVQSDLRGDWQADQVTADQQTRSEVELNFNDSSEFFRIVTTIW